MGYRCPLYIAPADYFLKAGLSVAQKPTGARLKFYTSIYL